MRYLFKILFQLIAIGAFSQGYVQPQPDLFGMARLANTSVSYFNGAVSVSIPLIQLPGRELTVPISLAYNGTGHKVQEVAGSTGLGWSLVGGINAVTRMVRGSPDEFEGGFCKSNSTDKEPDLFFATFLGRTVKFVLDRNGNPVIQPYQDLLIRPGICTGAGAGIWEIVDENGVKYIFGKTMGEREYTTTRIVGSASAQYYYTSAWFLSEVISPDATDRILFSYQSTSASYRNYFFSKYEGCAPDLSVKDQSTDISISSKVPDVITTSMGSLHFSWKDDREDLRGSHRLESMTMKDYNGTMVSKMKFSHGYFSEPGCTGELCKRLRLESISDLSPEPIYKFTYDNVTNLPARDSKNFDHWGYYNRNTVNSWIAENIRVQPPLAPVTLFSGASRQPDAQRSLANMLLAIDNREGGRIAFEYEQHEGAGGARIKNVDQHDGHGNRMRKSYRYMLSGSASSGIVFNIPAYMIFLDANTGDIKDETMPGPIITARRFSSAFSQLLDVNGHHIGYSRVEEITEGAGKVVYYFSNFDRFPDELLTQGPPFAASTSRAWERGNIEKVEVFDVTGTLISEETYHYAFNIREKRRVLGERRMEIVASCPNYSARNETYVWYQFISQPFTLTKVVRETTEQDNPSKRMVTETEYRYDPINFALTGTTHLDKNRPGVKYSNETKFVNHPDFSFSSSPGVNCENEYTNCASGCSNESDPLLQAICYSTCQNEFNNCTNSNPTTASPEVAAIIALRNRHQVSIPVETNQMIEQGGQVMILSSQLNLFSRLGTTPIIRMKEVRELQQKILQSSFVSAKARSDGTLQSDPALRSVATFDSYDNTNGNLLQTTSIDGIVTRYEYDAVYGKRLPTRVTTNPNASHPQHKTITYKPLVGVLTETDANGLVSRKQYDAYGRVSIVRDGDNNIIQRFRYHHKGETPGFVIDAVPFALPNTSTLFKVADIVCPSGGGERFLWDMGDGRVIENVQSVWHSYSQPGTYTIKVVMLSSEYKEFVRTATIDIVRALQSQICIDGVASADLCGVDPTSWGACTSLQIANRSILLANPIPGHAGCPVNYSYVWQFRNANIGGEYTTIGTEQSVSFNSPGEGIWEIRCTMTDDCGQSHTSYQYVTYYRSSSNCVPGRTSVDDAQTMPSDDESGKLPNDKIDDDERPAEDTDAVKKKPGKKEN